MRHFIKEKLDQKIVQFPFIKLGDSLADVLTKGVWTGDFHRVIDKLGMIDVYAPT